MSLIGPSDMYGDLSLEDVEEFEGLQVDNGQEVDPEGRFQRDEVRSFERDFEEELDNPDDDAYWQDYEYPQDEEYSEDEDDVEEDDFWEPDEL